MSEVKDKKPIPNFNIILIVLLFAWIVLLVALIGINISQLRARPEINNPASSSDFWNTPASPAPTKGVTPDATPPATPVLTATPTPTVTPTNTPTMTPTPTLSPTPIATPTPVAYVDSLVLSGVEEIDREIRAKYTELTEADEELAYETYTVENYFSVVFHKLVLTEETDSEVLCPFVYDLTTKQQVTAEKQIKQSYMAIVKERLQDVVLEKFPETAGEAFTTYQQIFEAEDYQCFYLTEDSLVFWFAEGILCDGQKAFSYEVPLSEAKAFFFYNLDGSKSGHAIRELDPNAKMVALTFDDGPYDVTEQKLLETLEEHNARATFFYLGDRVDDRESWYNTAKMVYNAGHEVGSHTYSHLTTIFKSKKKSDMKQMWQEFNMANLSIANCVGHSPDYIRLPGGSLGQYSKQFPMVVVNWNQDTEDWREKKKSDGAEIIYNRIIKSGIKDGDIILMHSIYNNSYKAASMLLDYLENKGYVCVTLSELFYYKGTNPEFGRIYYEGYGIY